MSAQIINFIIGIVILLVSTNSFVALAKYISVTLKLSPLIVGLTVVAIGTSLPEFTVSVIAAFKGDSGLAFGNIVGSNITNSLLVLPIGILIGRLRVGTTKTQRSSLLMLAATVLFSGLILSRYPPLLSGIFLLAGVISVTLAEYFWGSLGRKKEDSARIGHFKKVKIRVSSIFIQLLSVFGIIIGGVILINAVETISRLSGISTTILGLSVTAVATSLPELFTTIFAQSEDEEKLTIGNLLGSNIYNLLLIGGATLFFARSETISVPEWIFLIGSTLVFAFIIFSYPGKVIPKIIGIILLSFFGLYLLTLGVIKG